jgi:chemotaxis protein MotA
MPPTAKEKAANNKQNVPSIRIQPPKYKADFATILGSIIAIGLIAGAVIFGSSDANFVNLPAFLIVIFGTMAATSISFSGSELKHVPGIIGQTLFRRDIDLSLMGRQLLDISTLAKMRGILALSAFEKEVSKDKFLGEAVQLVVDGYTGDDIDRILGTEVDSLVRRHKEAASIMSKAADIAPAMGLIGTLVGLVQMLSQLDDPTAIGPAMAIALLTTFYGAVFGTIILSPLSAKLDRNSTHEAILKDMIMTAMASIARQENPRRLEMLLNSGLPREERIKYFE